MGRPSPFSFDEIWFILLSSGLIWSHHCCHFSPRPTVTVPCKRPLRPLIAPSRLIPVYPHWAGALKHPHSCTTVGTFFSTLNLILAVGRDAFRRSEVAFPVTFFLFSSLCALTFFSRALDAGCPLSLVSPSEFLSEPHILSLDTFLTTSMTSFLFFPDHSILSSSL